MKDYFHRDGKELISSIKNLICSNIFQEYSFDLLIFLSGKFKKEFGTVSMNCF